MKNRPLIKNSVVNTIFAVAIVAWTLILLLLLIWNVNNLREQISSIFLSQSRATFNLIVTTRYWNSLHGGVYVPVTEKTQPNPYLEIPERDLETDQKGLLTLINPAFMTRQISELVEEKDRIKFHITSLDPLNPANAPDPWEIKALNTYSSENDEYFDLIKKDKKGGSYFRYMAPLWVTQPCLKCHEKQGYSEGDLRGGISITTPADTFINAQKQYINYIVFAYFAIWFSIMTGAVAASLIIKKEVKQREVVIEQLQTALNDVNALKGLIPICASCKKIRDDKGYWSKLEKYITERSDAEFTHSICPECRNKLYPELTFDDK